MSLIDEFRGNGESKGRVFGVTVGVVTNNKDPESLGRVKLKLPIRECENETDWVRIAMPMSGNQMGTFFLPEVNDEVLVAFNEGDIRQPFVIGSLWNSQQKPPETNSDGKNNIRKIKSRCGHMITMDDTEGSEKISIASKSGMAVEMDEKTSKITIKDKDGKDTIVIDGTSQKVSVKAGMSFDVTCGGCSLKLDGASNSIEIKSGLSLKIEAKMIDIKAGANMNIESSGILNAKGAMVKIN